MRGRARCEVPSVERRLSSRLTEGGPLSWPSDFAGFRSSILARLPRVSWRSRKRESKEAGALPAGFPDTGQDASKHC